MTRFLKLAGAGLVGALVMVPMAFASGGAAPTFNATTLTAPLNDYGTTLLAGLVILIGIVLVVKAPFALVRIAMRAINKVFGSSKPAVG